MAGGNPKTGYEDILPHERISHQNYGAIIEKSYKLLTTDELRKMVTEYNAKSPYEKRFRTNKAEKIEHKVAVKILKERKGLERKVK